MDELKNIREDLKKAKDNQDMIALGFAINRLDTLIYNLQKNQSK